MVANKLPATVLAQVFLLVIAGFAVSLYILPTATGTANGNLNLHNSNIPCLRCFLFARRLSAYILGHHLKIKKTCINYEDNTATVDTTLINKKDNTEETNPIKLVKTDQGWKVRFE